MICRGKNAASFPRLSQSSKTPTRRLRTSQRLIKRYRRKCEKAQSVQDASDDRSSATLQSSGETFSPEKYCTAQDTDRTKRRLGKAERKLERKFRNEARNKPGNGKSRCSVAFPLVGNVDLQPHSPLRQALAKHTAPNTVIHSRAPVAVAGGRHAVRQQYIRHKRMAMIDSKALNEVCRRTESYSAKRILILSDIDDQNLAYTQKCNQRINRTKNPSMVARPDPKCQSMVEKCTRTILLSIHLFL